MRKLSFVFILLIGLPFAFISCDEDDVIINPPDNGIVLTSENNLYEGDLYILYLEEEIISTENTIFML
ncbi:hypothetical protein, partial [Bizionia echini]